jgi:F5/8 type C domain
MGIKRVLLSIALLLVTAHRLPAPIQEIPESPTPAPEQSAKPKRTIKPKTTSESSESSTKRQTASPQSRTEAASNRKPFNIPQSQMTASATSQYSGYEASKAIDGNVSTMWHTPWGLFGPEISLPQSITLNLGGTYNVNKLRYLPRQKSGIGDLNGNILTYKIYASTDGSNFTQIAAGNWFDDHGEKSAIFAPTKASYIRLEAIATHAGHASAAELNITATQ